MPFRGRALLPRYPTFMPSDRPKVTAYITAEASAALDDAARALGQSRSRLVAELIDAAIPLLRVTADAARVVSGASEMQREALAGLAGRMSPVLEESEGLMTELAAIVGRWPDGPPPSNTGVRTS